MLKKITIFVLILFQITSITCSEEFPKTYIEFAPEVSWGMHDNGPAWFEFTPANGNLQITDRTSVAGGVSYFFEIPRAQKPIGGINHHGYRICARLEHELGADIRGFYEINIGQRVDGAHEDIQYLQTRNYQRFGVKWLIQRVIFQ
jgi:hypothetical protein